MLHLPCPHAFISRKTRKPANLICQVLFKTRVIYFVIIYLTWKITNFVLFGVVYFVNVYLCLFRSKKEKGGECLFRPVSIDYLCLFLRRKNTPFPLGKFCYYLPRLHDLKLQFLTIVRLGLNRESRGYQPRTGQNPRKDDCASR